jgi:hypothetical protein
MKDRIPRSMAGTGIPLSGQWLVSCGPLRACDWDANRASAHKRHLALGQPQERDTYRAALNEDCAALAA